MLGLALLALTACQSAPADYGRPLPPGAPALLLLRPGEPRPDLRASFHDREEIWAPLSRSIEWTRREYAKQFFPIEGIDHELAQRSLERFQELLITTKSANEFQAAFDREFDVYKSAGWDARGGGVLFTGYCTPILAGSLAQSDVYRHPLYSLPGDLVKASDGTILGQRNATTGQLLPYPERRTIEAGLLRGQSLELVYLRDPLDAFIAHVNGSAIIQLEDGSEVRFGYAGKNGRPYTSLGQELIDGGQISKQDISLGTIRQWAKEHPELVSGYLDRNESYVFFTPIDGNPHGSLNVPVQGERSLATDKRLFPRGALVFVDCYLPSDAGRRTPFRQLMFDQDTGGAIRTAGRADIYVGVGHTAERRAGATKSPGQLYYFFLRD